jgi:hypothetical protein
MAVSGAVCQSASGDFSTHERFDVPSCDCYPHWDFDLPSTILGGNAARVFGLHPKPVKKLR